MEGKAKINWMQRIDKFISREIITYGNKQEELDLLATLEEMVKNLKDNIEAS